MRQGSYVSSQWCDTRDRMHLLLATGVATNYMVTSARELALRLRQVFSLQTCVLEFRHMALTQTHSDSRAHMHAQSRH